MNDYIVTIKYKGHNWFGGETLQERFRVAAMNEEKAKQDIVNAYSGEGTPYPEMEIIRVREAAYKRK